MPADLTQIGDGNVYYTTRNAIPFVEMPGLQETWADDQTQIVRRLACLWNDAGDFRRDMVGSVEWSAGQSNLTRNLPQFDFEYESFYAESFQLVQALGQFRGSTNGQYSTVVDISELDGSDPTDGLAVYDVLFRKPLYEVLEDGEIDTELDRYIIRQSQESVEGLPLPTGFLIRKDLLPDVTPYGGQVDLLFPKATHIYRWIRVPVEAYPKNTVKSIQGKVNSVTFDVDGENITAGKAMFLGPSKRLYQGRDGITYYDVDYAFEERERSYQEFPDAEGNFVELARASNTAEGAFLTADFHDLFDVSLG